MQRDQFLREYRKLIKISAGKAIIDVNGAALDPSQSREAIAESSKLRLRPWIVRRHAHKYTDPPRRRRLLRARYQRPCRRTASNRDELPPLHSITSSARASSEGGTVRPRAFAVLRFIASSYFVGACTGRSAGFSPFKIRFT